MYAVFYIFFFVKFKLIISDPKEIKKLIFITKIIILDWMLFESNFLSY